MYGRGRRTCRRRRIAKELGLRVFMRADNKRFLIILACLLIGVPAIDIAVKWSRNAIQQLRFDLVTVGMSEAEAIRLTGHDSFARTAEVFRLTDHDPLASTNNTRKIVVTREIVVWKHQSLFETIFPPNSAECQFINIETGTVVGTGVGGLSFK